MAVESPTLKPDVQTEPHFTWPVELPISSPEFLKGLQVPKSVLQDTRLVGQFFASQGARYRALYSHEKIKSLSAEIPEFETVAQDLEDFNPLTTEEEAALEGLYGEVQAGIQSAGLDSLLSRADEYLKQHPVPQGAVAGPGDIWDQAFMMEVGSQNEDREKKWRELLANAKDPETVALIIGFKATDFFSKKMVRAFESYRYHIDQLDRTVAKMGLEGASAADIAKANAELSKNQSFIGMITFTIQAVKQKIDEAQNTTQSILQSIHEKDKQIIANVRQ